ncbi:hypothetical protein C7271_23705 [filamentous cyanobacterium CCP5]|nr:hypothetical protein C7271_23705 [filamentous cyanobacterium CCP5]
MPLTTAIAASTLAGLCLGLTLVSCQGDQPEADILSPSEASGEEASEPSGSPPAATGSDLPAAAADAAIAPGRYCYSIDSETLSGVVRLTVAEGQEVSGDGSFTIHNEEASYYSSYIQQLEGSLYQGEISTNIRTWIEYDVQDSQEVWQISPESLQTEGEDLSAIPCEVAKERWLGPDGLLEAADLLEAPTAINTQRVEFEPGAFSATVENAVVRGERDRYLVNAQGGQNMILSITSLEDNAVFDVISPGGLLLERETTQSDLILPYTGDYQILVGGTRGNASYTLDIEIE